MPSPPGFLPVLLLDRRLVLTPGGPRAHAPGPCGWLPDPGPRMSGLLLLQVAGQVLDFRFNNHKPGQEGGAAEATFRLFPASALEAQTAMGYPPRYLPAANK